MPLHNTHPLPFSSIGTVRTLGVFIYGAPHANLCIYIQAALHADELPGTARFHNSVAGMRVAFELRRRLLQLELRCVGQNLAAE